MSDDNEADTSCCASCGITENDDVKLKKCNGCYLVKYCGIECQNTHRKQHKRECKKRAAELRDELLFTQPESSHLGDCPICCLPLSLVMKKSTMMGCCSKIICHGCDYANQEREIKGGLPHACPFCRKETPKTKEEADKLIMKRIEANDPFALCQEGTKLLAKGDYNPAFEYLTKAADLGDIDAHYKLGAMYNQEQGVQKDDGKMIYHWEKAAIGGHPYARCSLGSSENNAKRAVKHWIIAATQGDDYSIKELMKAFKKGVINKDELDATLRAHKAAIDATKSKQRRATAQNCTAGIWGLQPFTHLSEQQAKTIAEEAVEYHLRSKGIDFINVTCFSKLSSSTGMFRIHADVVAPDDDRYAKMTPMERFVLVTDPLVGFEFIEGPLTGRLRQRVKSTRRMITVNEVLKHAEAAIHKE